MLQQEQIMSVLVGVSDVMENGKENMNADNPLEPSLFSLLDKIQDPSAKPSHEVEEKCEENIILQEKDLKDSLIESECRLKSFIEDPPDLELKQLPKHL